MKPYLWIAYDYTSISQCLSMLDSILEQHQESNLIHEIGRPTLLKAALEGVPIVSEFRHRLNNNQKLVVDFKGYEVPYSAEGQFYYAAGTDLVTVMATAPNEAIQEAIDGANAEVKLVAFDLMACLSDDWKVSRAKELADLGANLVSCHTGWSEQAAGKTPTALVEKVCDQLKQDLRNCHMRSQPASGKGMSESAASAGSGGSRRIRSDVAQSSQSIECVSRVIGSGRWLTRGEARERFLGRKLEIRKISQLQAQ